MNAKLFVTVLTALLLSILTSVPAAAQSTNIDPSDAAIPTAITRDTSIDIITTDPEAIIQTESAPQQTETIDPKTQIAIVSYALKALGIVWIHDIPLTVEALEQYPREIPLEETRTQTAYTTKTEPPTLPPVPRTPDGSVVAAKMPLSLMPRTTDDYRPNIAQEQEIEELKRELRIASKLREKIEAEILENDYYQHSRIPELEVIPKWPSDAPVNSNEISKPSTQQTRSPVIKKNSAWLIRFGNDYFDKRDIALYGLMTAACFILFISWWRDLRSAERQKIIRTITRKATRLYRRRSL